MDLLTFVTAGSVDDGKSTVIGRLLHDTGAVAEDQLDAVDRASRRRGRSTTDLALLTDGLRDERDQGITIDAAYRYFGTGRRTFIIADTPGHVQYTRNMVCGASVAEAAVLLVDARNGITEQTRRHLCVLALLGVRHVVLAVNKMDLCGYDRARFERCRSDMADADDHFGPTGFTAIPISALDGDNVVRPSENMPWYDGPTLLEHLETLPLEGEPGLQARFPVQCVLRPGAHELADYRAYAGQMAGGVLQVGDPVVVWPSGLRSTVAGISGPGGELTEAWAPMSVSIRTADEIDISRGDVVCATGGDPQVTDRADASVCWTDDRPARPGARFLLKQFSRTVPVRLDRIHHLVDVATGDRIPGDELALNDVARVQLATGGPILCDRYADNPRTGSFILIEPDGNRTVAVGMLAGPAASDEGDDRR